MRETHAAGGHQILATFPTLSTFQRRTSFRSEATLVPSYVASSTPEPLLTYVVSVAYIAVAMENHGIPVAYGNHGLRGFLLANGIECDGYPI